MVRLSTLIGCVLAIHASTANADDPAPSATLTEHDVIISALGRAPLRDSIEGAITAEEGRADAARAYPNPELSYAREQTFGNAGTAENYLVAAQTIDIARRRHRRGQAGDLRARAIRQDGETTRLSIAATARQRFYEALYRQKRVATLERWVAHVGEALDIVTRREKRGDAAAYDRKRLEREQTVTNGRLATERAQLAAARARLSAMLGAASKTGDATGTLLPDADPPDAEALTASSLKRPDFAALDLLARASDLDRTAAARWWLPDLRFELGWKGVDLGAAGRTDGFVAGASLAFPLWDRSEGLDRIAQGEARAARGRRALLASEVVGEIAGAREEAISLRRAAIDFRRKTASGDLVHMATVGYEAGEVSVLELLDAYRGAAEDETTSLEMELSARRSRIELDRLTGAKLP